MLQKTFNHVIYAAALFMAASGCGLSPQAREARFLKKGQERLTAKDYTRALIEFRNAAQAMPRAAEPYYRLGLAYLQSHDSLNAARAFKQATQLDPKHSGAQLKLAELMAASGSRELVSQASTKIETLLAESPDNAEAIDTLAMAEFKLGDIEKAATRLEDLLRNTPARLESSVILARIKVRQGDLTGAEDVLKKARANAPQSASAALALGQFYLSSRRPEKAEAEIREALQLEPRNVPALLTMGDMQLAAKRIDEAGETYKVLAALPDKTYRTIHALFQYQIGRKAECLEELKSLAVREPDDRSVRSRLVSINVEMSKLQEARDILGAALKRNPNDADALLQRSQLYLRLGKPSDADSDLQKLLKTHPNSGEAHFALSGVYRAQGRRNLENQELETSLKWKPELLAARVTLARNLILASQPKSALWALDNAPAAQKNAAGVAIQRNWALIASGQIIEAGKLLERQLPHNRLTELLLQNAVVKMSRRDYPGARQDAEEGLKGNPEDARLARIIAETYVGQGNPAKAQQRLIEIASAQPKSAQLQSLLGEWYLDAEKLEDARKAYETAKGVNPKSRAIDLHLAEIDRRQGRLEDARHRLDGIVATESDNVPALLLLADMDEAAGNHAAAMLRYRVVLETDSSNVYALNNLAYDLVSGDPNEALKFAQRAGELAPDNASVQDTLALVFHRKGIDATAITYLKTAVAKEPTARRQFHLGMCYLKSGQEDLGQKTLRAALAKDPNLEKTEQDW
jgi:tetratricopeptide (TPR) repeat protein